MGITWPQFTASSLAFMRVAGELGALGSLPGRHGPPRAMDPPHSPGASLQSYLGERHSSPFYPTRITRILAPRDSDFGDSGKVDPVLDQDMRGTVNVREE